jgi:cytochrome c2
MKVVVFTLIGLSCISLPFAFPAKVAHVGVSITGKVDAGAESYKRYCAACHSVEPDHKLVGPSLYSEMRAASKDHKRCSGYHHPRQQNDAQVRDSTV